IFFNRRFVELWDLPDEVVESRSDEAALAAMRERLADPDAFLQRVAHLYAHPDEESRDELELKDRRVFDRYSAPVRGEDGTHYGRAWFFRDVTDERRHEEGLRFLAQASALLSESLDYEDALGAVAQL